MPQINRERTLVQKIVGYRGIIALAAGIIIAGHMAYQHVYVNQMKPTTLTRCEKVAAVVLMAYGAGAEVYRRRKDNS